MSVSPVPSVAYWAMNDPALGQGERLAALDEYLAECLVAGPDFPDFIGESNNHIHTVYSFSPYTPTFAALRGRMAGLPVVGSVDHDSYKAAPEMSGACKRLGMGAITGFEIRAFIHSHDERRAGTGAFEARKINNPDSYGVAYLTVQGVPARASNEVEAFLEPVRKARYERTEKMAARANEILEGFSIATFDWQRDVVERSQYSNGGSITERHLLAAMARALISGFGRGQQLLDALGNKLGMNVPAALRQTLADPENPYLDYDLLGILKSEYLDRIYIQPTDELYTAAEVVRFADSIGAVAAYPYLGDVTASATGDKKAEKFEDEFLEDLLDYLVQIGFRAVTYMPTRNTPEQMARISALAAERGLLQVSGVDINQPRQTFNCPQLQDPANAHLNTTTWALVAHEALSNVDHTLSILGQGNPIENLDTRLETYARLGHALAIGETDVADCVEELGKLKA
ncbi:MAG: PHP domain-containing protein [Actinomycetaceae bacterium]|nr:PHP domain-containing protein [Actinomycetaceae bacterium]